MRPPGLRLLVVDDEEQILELLELTLSLQGFRVATARSGPGALEAASRTAFDVVVLDVLMTPWDGFETARRLHAHLARALPPVVFLSGLSRPDVLPALPVPTRYLVKPFRPAELVACIHEVAARN